MGLFSSKKKVVVSSTVYNLAGPVAERGDFLRTATTAAMLSPQGQNTSFTNYLTNTILSGPALRQRQFQSWSEKFFPIGTPKTAVVNSAIGPQVNYPAYLPIPPSGSTNEPMSAHTAYADFFLWAEQYILVNNPTAWSGNWTADYDSTADTITIQYPDATTATFTPSGYVLGKYYLYVYYTLVTPQPNDPQTGEPQPDKRELRLWIYQIGSGIAELDALLATASEEEPEFYPFIPLRIANRSIRDSYYSSTVPIYDDCRKAYRKAMGNNKQITKLLDDIEANEDIGDIDNCFFVYGVPLNTQDNTSKLYLYEFFKRLIPYQQWSILDFNTWVAEIESRTLGVVDNVKANAISEEEAGSGINYITVGWAVYTSDNAPMLTVGNTYEFITENGRVYSLKLYDYTYNVSGTTWKFEYDPTRPVDEYPQWSTNEDNVTIRIPLALGEIAPEPAINTIRLYSENSATQAYDMRISWVTIDENVYTGLAKTGAQTGDVWVELGQSKLAKLLVLENWVDEAEFEHVIITHQTGADSYRKIEIWGLVHQNYVYKNKDVYIRAKAALNDPDESGFLVPMHAPTLENMSLLQRNQLTGHNAYLVFNSYVVKTIKWYERGIFKILLAVAMIAITIAITYFTGGFGALAASGGILGTNLSVGAAIGLSGTAAAIGGAVANAIAAMVVTMVISQGAKLIFGDEMGALIGAIASFVTIQFLTSFQLTGNLAMSWEHMMKAENLLKLTSAVSRGVQGYTQGRVEELEEDLVDLTADYENQMREIEKRTAELLGYSGTVLDPLMFLEESDTSGPRLESSSSFLRRTLLTGSDIAAISHGMISDFPRLSLELPKYTN